MNLISVLEIRYKWKMWEILTLSIVPFLKLFHSVIFLCDNKRTSSCLNIKMSKAHGLGKDGNKQLTPFMRHCVLRCNWCKRVHMLCHYTKNNSLSVLASLKVNHIGLICLGYNKLFCSLYNYEELDFFVVVLWVMIKNFPVLYRKH